MHCRVPYSSTQTRALEETFTRMRFIDSRTKDKLAQELNLSSRQVGVWFQVSNHWSVTNLKQGYSCDVRTALAFS